MYIAIQNFKDIEDDFYEYKIGKPYPREGAKAPSPERIRELSSYNNRRRMPLIEELPESRETEAERGEEQEQEPAEQTVAEPVAEPTAAAESEPKAEAPKSGRKRRAK